MFFSKEISYIAHIIADLCCNCSTKVSAILFPSDALVFPQLKGDDEIRATLFDQTYKSRNYTFLTLTSDYCLLKYLVVGFLIRNVQCADVILVLQETNYSYVTLFHIQHTNHLVHLYYIFYVKLVDGTSVIRFFIVSLLFLSS